MMLAHWLHEVLVTGLGIVDSRFNHTLVLLHVCIWIAWKASHSPNRSFHDSSSSAVMHCVHRYQL